MSAYENGKKALTGVLSDKRLNADHVTETMLDIQEVIILIIAHIELSFFNWHCLF